MDNPNYFPADNTPPPLSPPPPVIAPAPKPRKGRGWMIASIILTVILVISLFGNVGLFFLNSLPFENAFDADGFSSSRNAGQKLEEFTLEQNKSVNKIAIIAVNGIITSHDLDHNGNTMVDLIAAQLDRAADDKHVKAVILKVDSPGGEVLASDDIYKKICAFQESTKKPVICSMGSLAASGGYYISSGCRWIVANELTLTGSIGVIMHGWNYRGLMDKVGVAPMTYKSGKFKDMLSGERALGEIPPEEQKMVQNLIDETYGKFKSVVATGRGTAHKLNKDDGKALADNWQEFADGRVVSGKQAFDIGLVDEIGDFDDAVDRAEKIAHIKNSNLIEYRRRYDLANFLSLFGESSQSHDIKLNVGIELPKLRAGLPYFLFQP